MRTSLMTFPDDLAADGVETVARRARERAGVDAVTLAATYHAARDLMPHRPRGRIVHTAAGAGGFLPAPARYGALAPQRSGPAAAGRDLLAELADACAGAQLDVQAWAVFLHADAHPGALAAGGGPDDAGREAPGRHVEHNAFGDPLHGQLCPSRPAVRAYARALAGDLAARGVTTVLAESLHHHGLAHGHHHERTTLPLSARTRLLLGLCFCDSCATRAAAAGIDAGRLGAVVRAAVDAALADPDEPDEPAGEAGRAELEAVCDGELGGYLRMREETVATLAAEAAAAAAAGGARLAVLDPSGSVMGYADGRPAGGPAADAGWRFGVDPAALARAGVAVEPIAYAADPARVALDLAAYRGRVGAGAPLAAVMRPSWPDCADPANLRAKLDAARAAGVERVDFYHYALAPLSALDRIAAALP